MSKDSYKTDVFTIGRCNECKYEKALKNGVCVECSKKQVSGKSKDVEMPDFLKDIFGKF